MDFLDPRLPSRFWAKCIPEPNSGCWLWVGSLRGGYGSIAARALTGRRTAFAHRLAYELLVGAVPAGTELDHKCRTPCCVNPAHLDPVSHRENCRRGHAGAYLAARTACPQGHPYDETNTYIGKRKSGSQNRMCILCRSEQKRRWRLARITP